MRPVALVIAAMALASCGWHTRTADHGAPRPSGLVVANGRTVKERNPDIRLIRQSVSLPPTAVVPDPDTATRDPLSAARAWAVAAYSSSYRDRAAGIWTARTRAFVTGTEANLEHIAARGAGGSTWTQIRRDHCALTLRNIQAAAPGDAPAGRLTRILELTATAALTCATGRVQLRPVAAQLVLIDRHSRWLVSSVAY